MWHISSSECKKVVSDIFGEIEFLMEYENIGLYAHFALYSKFLALLFSKISSKMCSKKATYDPIALIFEKCVKCKRVESATYDPLAITFGKCVSCKNVTSATYDPLALSNWYP